MNNTASIEQPPLELIDQPVEPTSIAIVRGQPFSEIPHDLYIPPEAMEVFLEAFSGPFDLLLYLIKRNNLDILDINNSYKKFYKEYCHARKQSEKKMIHVLN